MRFKALIIFGETNPLTDPITAPIVITPISEQLEDVTGDRAAATVKADDRILNLPVFGSRARRRAGRGCASESPTHNRRRDGEDARGPDRLI
jgi:hypothetical protein